jgi:nucleotide-binding universal stress UspA family protein
LTDFSEACYQAIPAAAEWIDREHGALTILHVHGGEAQQRRNASAKMQSFFAEADRYDSCERVLVEGQTIASITQYCQERKPDLVFAPATQPAGLPRIFRKSLRAHLLKQAQVRIWTRGRKGNPSPSRCPSPDNVIYSVTGHDNWVQELRMAARAADFHNARFHVAWLTPHMEVSEGTTAADLRLGPPKVAMKQLLEEIEKMPVMPEIHRAIGDEHRDLRRLIQETNADLIFAGEKHVLKRSFGGSQFNADLDRLDCEVICFPERSGVGLSAEAPQTVQLPLPEWQEN